MKSIKKDLLCIGIMIAILSIGGFINDYFLKGEPEYSKQAFQIFSLVILVCGLIAYPWRKRPWTSFAGAHTIFCAFIWLGGIELIHWHASPIKHLYYLFKGPILIISGIYLLVQNYKGKYVKLFEIKNNKNI